jgi:hypothetical protein
VFRRLSLPRYNCSWFMVRLHFDGKQLATNLDQSQRNYGSTYRRNSEPHAVSGRLHPIGDTERYHAELVYRSRDLGEPPKSFAPVDVLWSLIESITEPVEVEAIATMNYPEEDWEPLVGVPIAFPGPVQVLRKFTHMEAATFSKRTGDDLQYSVEISKGGQKQILMTVRSFREAPFSGSLVANMLRECSKVSHFLVRPRGKGQ